MAFRYFDYLSHFVGGLLLSYSYFIFSLNFEQPQNLARGNFAVRTDCVATPLQSTAIVSCNVVLNDMTTHGTESQPSKHQLNMLLELPVIYMMKPDFASA